MNFEFQSEVISLIQNHYENHGVKYDINVDLHRAIVDFLNLKFKLINQVPRQVFVSEAIRNLKLTQEYNDSLNFILEKIKKGEDLTPHQSKQILNPKYNDLLLNNWIIYHVHLSNKKLVDQYFYDRSDLVLFAIFTDSQAFLIDIQRHKEINLFSKKKMLEIVWKNWPEILKHYIISDEETKRYANNYSDSEINKLRKNGYLLGLIEIDNKTFRSPGLGNTTSGHNIHLITQANSVYQYLNETNIEIINNYNQIKEQLSGDTGINLNELKLAIHLHESFPYFAFYEFQSGRYIEKNYDKKL